MPAGTIKLTNNSATVTGTGTSFTTELTANDFLVVVSGGVTYTLAVSSVDSDTMLTLNTAYTGPTSAELAWRPVPNATLVGITAQVAADVAKAIRGLNADKANWQQVFSENSAITVRLPDGSAFTGPSWLRIVELLKDVDLDGLQIIAEQVHADATQVSQDKTTASTAATTATNAAKTATDKATAAGTSATNAAKSETAAEASATSASDSAITATQEADRARAAADEAAQYAGDMDFTMADVRAYVDAVYPVGMRMDWPLASLPDNPALGIKFLRLTGASFDETLYPKLAPIYPSGILPDMRGNVARGYDDGRGIDQDRALLSEQLDAAPNITGNVANASAVQIAGTGTAYPILTKSNGAFTNIADVRDTGYGISTGQTINGNRVSMDASNSNPAYGRANEVRMRNMAWNMIVRAS
ncbi:hypothetical protein M1D48_12115 [Erwinia sp. D4-22]